MKSKTKMTEDEILRFAKRRKRFHLGTDIKPMFSKGMPVTFAIWNLVRAGKLTRLGRGNYKI